ncbi:MAG: hypothetical protein K1X57_21410, partial [Gemmataceae bacterium]|nr:hypothetical protein [Gemmataceae bacterium]
MNVRRHDERTALSIAAPARPDSRQRQTTVLWIIALLLAVIATALLTRGNNPFALPQAHGDAPMAGARGIFAFTGQIDRNRFGLFMMDVDSSNVWCYEYLPGTRKLKLVAARSFLYDRYLDDYETEEPSPRQVKGMLEKQRQAVGRNNGFADAGDDVDAAKAIDTNEPVNTVAPIDV